MLTTLIHKIKQYIHNNKTQPNIPHKMNTYTAYHEIKYPHTEIRYPICFDHKNRKIIYEIPTLTDKPKIKKKGRSIYNKNDTFTLNFQNSILNIIPTKHKL